MRRGVQLAFLEQEGEEKELQEALPAHRPGRLDPGGIEGRGREVLSQDQLPGGGPRPDDPGPPHQRRHLQTRVGQGALAMREFRSPILRAQHGLP
jgi:hypothetical protein